MRPAVLVLAGTAEAVELCTRLAAGGEVDVTASLAGRTRAPAPLPCPVRTGGFGGEDGLAAALADGGYDLVVDATHPFADRMPHQAAAAAARVGVPRLRLLRPPWVAGPGDRWHPVADMAGAAVALDALDARRVLLTVGRQELAAFAGAATGGRVVVVRSIDPPAADLVPGATVVLDRPPFTLAAERALFAEHRIDTLVTRNSGGAATAPKLEAAREAGVRVVLVARPAPPPGPTVAAVDEAVAWATEVLRGVS